MSAQLKCLPRPRIGVLHVPLVISVLDNAPHLVEINMKKDNCTPMGLSQLISISKSNSVIVYYSSAHFLRQQLDV